MDITLDKVDEELADLRDEYHLRTDGDPCGAAIMPERSYSLEVEEFAGNIDLYDRLDFWDTLPPVGPLPVPFYVDPFKIPTLRSYSWRNGRRIIWTDRCPRDDSYITVSTDCRFVHLTKLLLIHRIQRRKTRVKNWQNTYGEVGYHLMFTDVVYHRPGLLSATVFIRAGLFQVSTRGLRKHSRHGNIEQHSLAST